MHPYKNLLQSKYLLLFFTLISSIFLLPLVNDYLIGRIIFSVIFFFIIVTVSYAAKSLRTNMKLLIILGFFGLAINLTGMINIIFSISGNLIIIAFYIYVIIILCRDVFINKNVTLEILIGSVCIYFLIAIAFATIYEIIQKIVPNAFIFEQSSSFTHTSFDFYYFSFVTITTIGFGDIVPHVQFAKSVVMLESITGIFYLTILVSRLVAMLKPRQVDS